MQTPLAKNLATGRIIDNKKKSETRRISRLVSVTAYRHCVRCATHLATKCFIGWVVEVFSLDRHLLNSSRATPILLGGHGSKSTHSCAIQMQVFCASLTKCIQEQGAVECAWARSHANAREATPELWKASSETMMLPPPSPSDTQGLRGSEAEFRQKQFKL